MKYVEHKRGDTLLWTCSRTRDGQPLPLPTGIEAHVRSDDDRLVQDLTVNRIDEPGGAFSLEAPATDTTNWPLGVLYMDIKYSEAGVDVRTETVRLNVIREWTK